MAPPAKPRPKLTVPIQRLLPPAGTAVPAGGAPGCRCRWARGRHLRGIGAQCVEHTPFLKTPGLTSVTLEVTNTLNRPRLSPEPLAQVKPKPHTSARPFCMWPKLLSVKSWQAVGGGGLPTGMSCDTCTAALLV